MDQFLSCFVFVFHEFVILLVYNQILALSRELNAIDNVIFYALAQNVGVVDVKLIQDFSFLFQSEFVDLLLRRSELVVIKILFLDFI